MGLTRDLGSFVSGLRYGHLPVDAVDVAKLGFTDTIGCLLAGRREAAVVLVEAATPAAVREATLLFGDGRSGAPTAALVNAIAAHALDFDDVALTGHPSAVLVPAILAEGEVLDASGEAMITAYVAGYESWAELVRRDSDFHHDKGWHPTSIFGAIAATAACTSLRGLDAEKATIAIALGSSMSAGVKANFGSMTKPLHAGRASEAGVIAARLAAAGFTATPDALEHPQGFLRAVSPRGRVDTDTPADGLGRDWRIAADRLSLKQYPNCFCTHRSIDAMRDLKRQAPFGPDAVAGVTVHISDVFARILQNHTAETANQAKFSMEFAMAAAIIADGAGLAEFRDDFVRRDDVQRLMRCVNIETNTDYADDGSGGSVADRVEVRLLSGEVVVSPPVAFPRGHAHAPLSRDALFAKFAGCVDAGGGGIATEALFEMLTNLDQAGARALVASATRNSASAQALPSAS